MTDRSHLSIGEVLSLLRDEFPDVTISKIRFLESQGLVDPERTPSGYRKFYEHDVDRLRWILRQQRENFLPLKVIKGRLTGHGDDTDGLEEADVEGPALGGADPAGPGGHQQGPAGPGGHQQGPAIGPSTEGAPAEDNGRVSAAPERHPGGTFSSGPPTSPPPSPPAAVRSEVGEAVTALASPEAPPAFGASTFRGSELFSTVSSDEDESFTLDELVARSGLDGAQVEELARYGLIAAQSSTGGTSYYDGEALAIATVSARFAAHGVEARHLRAWRTAAEREVSLFEQVVIPLLRQRNPQARSEAAATLDELADLGAELREILVRRAVRDVH